MRRTGLRRCPDPSFGGRGAPDAAIVVDAKTGKTLYADNPDAKKRYPASLTKMMTLYLLFEALDAGRDHSTPRSPSLAHAAAQQPSKLDVAAGHTIGVRDAILSLVTRSANDMAVAIAEYLAGRVAFAAEMTKKARELGMSNTTFRNASGLPDSGQVTTARHGDARSGLCASTTREYYSFFFSTQSFVFGTASASATTTPCSARSTASTASRPASPAPPASIS